MSVLLEYVRVGAVVGVYLRVGWRVEEIAPMLHQSKVINLLDFKIPLFVSMEYSVRPSEEVLLLLSERAQLKTRLELMRHPCPYLVIVLDVAVLEVIGTLIHQCCTERRHISEHRGLPLHILSLANLRRHRGYLDNTLV